MPPHFARGFDRIDLSTIDAQAGSASNDAFVFVGQAAFSGGLGELRFQLVDAAGTTDDRTIIQADVNGDRVADFEIVIVGQATTMQAGDFIF